MVPLTRRFFLQAVDADFGCAVLEAMFEVPDLVELHTILKLPANEDLELRGCYEIDADTRTVITTRFGVVFDPDGREVRLERWHALRAVPYLVHTNYELFLLVHRMKSLARELELYPPHMHFEEHLFDRYVREGLLNKEVSIRPFATPVKARDGHVYDGEREVFYTIKGEEWRIPAWRLIRAASLKSGWSDHFERLEGMLYGYDEWQMDWWMAHRNGLGLTIPPPSGDPLDA